VSKEITVLDIQDRVIRGALIKYSSGKCHIARSAVEYIPDSLSSDIIRLLLDKMGLNSPKNVVVAINGRDASIRLIELELPNLIERKPDEIEGIIRNLLSEHIPMRIEQTYYDYQIMHSDSHGTTVLVVAMKQNVLKGYINTLVSAGIYPDIITISPIALYNTIATNDPESIGHGNIGLIHLREFSGDIALVEDGILRYARSFSYQMDADKEHIIREITNSLATYSKSRSLFGDWKEKNPISIMHLMTGTETPIDLTEDDLSQIAPESKWNMHNKIDELLSGIALMNTNSQSATLLQSFVGINLYKQVYKENRVAKNKIAKVKMQQMAPIIVAIMLLLSAIILGWQDIIARNELRYAENIMQTSKKQISDISVFNKTEEEMLDRAKALNWALDEYPIISYRLYGIARAIPESLWLKEIYIPVAQVKKKKKDEQPPISILNVVGYAHEQSQIEDFINRLKNYDCFSEVRQEALSEVMLTGERVLEFNIRLRSNRISDEEIK
jgi:hypothetical protein